MNRLFCLLALFCPYLSPGQSTTNTYVTISGTIVSENKIPIAAADLYLTRSKKRTASAANGSFTFSSVQLPDTLVVSEVGYATRRIPLLSDAPLMITLTPLSQDLGEVVVSTGYQQIPKERAAGSFVQIDNRLLNRSVGSNILDRLDGVTSGLIFNHNAAPAANESPIIIRGRSTLFASPDPLIILDNFPYDGDLNSINPNDIETITLLRDAAAASIWGVRSGNGVIVITTKKGKAGAAPRISFNTNLTITAKPDLYYQDILSSKDYFGMESFLFDKGYYNSRITNAYQSISPAVEIFAARKAGQISASDSASLIDQLAATDLRTDLLRYFYRPATLQQYALSVSGGSSRNQYYLSAGYDKNLDTRVNNGHDRVTLRARNNLELIPGKLELVADINLAATTTNTTGNLFNRNYPIYTKLVDANGKALPVYKDYRKTWLDSIGGGQLLDWNFRPYDELSLADDHTELTEYRLLTALNWHILPQWELSLNYQYAKGVSEENDFNSLSSYNTRDLLNRYTLPNYTGGSAVFQIPMGAYLDISRYRYTSQNARIQTSYSHRFGKQHELNLLGGAEIKDFNSFSSAERLYGYNRDNATDQPVDNINRFSTLPTGGQSTIPSINGQTGITDRYLSYFANAGYRYRDRYLLNLSARKDESNLFGVDANQKGVPLWSAGLGWIMTKEKWVHTDWLSFLKMRLTYGYNGNVDKSTSAYTTAGVGSNSVFLQPSAYLINPANPELSWEKIAILNTGMDFSLFHGKLSGSLDYFVKNGKGLIGNSEVAAQTGVTQFRQNIADIRTTGMDLVLDCRPLNRSFQWNIHFLYSHAADKVLHYLLPANRVKAYVTTITSNPYEGKPWSAVFAYRWAGLSAVNGDPQGIADNQISTNYSRLVNPLSTDELVYFGAGRPTSYGSLRNDFAYHHFTLSVNITYALGYWFRRDALNYTNTFGASRTYGIPANGELLRRWQQPGDELLTNTPSMAYPASSTRDEFYQYAEVNVEKGDHVRLRDLRIGYELPMGLHKKSPVRSWRFYLYVNNIGILWRANHSHLDPDNVTGYPTPRSFALGTTIEF
jgi:TonB-linked SusC/RagA family outer membrane protein